MRLAATAAACGAILAAAALPASAAGRGAHHPAPRPLPQRSQVVLGAVQADSPGSDNGSARSLNNEWVTVVNDGRNAVDLSGWTLSDAEHHTYRFHTLRLAGHQSVRVHSGFGRDTARDVYQDSRTYLWRNAADTATLRDARGQVVSVRSWGRPATPPRHAQHPGGRR